LKRGKKLAPTRKDDKKAPREKGGKTRGTPTFDRAEKFISRQRRGVLEKNKKNNR